MEEPARQQTAAMDSDSASRLLPIVDQGDSSSGKTWPAWPLSRATNTALHLGRERWRKIAPPRVTRFLAGESGTSGATLRG